ncbi:MAG TPA: TRAP transporter large permease subunit [Dehalococcoidia bacterium]|nr:TRAP transporter large permease subunit [Dehalococcoidia bacterium]
MVRSCPPRWEPAPSSWPNSWSPLRRDRHGRHPAGHPLLLGFVATIHFEALTRGLRPVPRSEIPKARDVFNWQLVRRVLPVTLMIILLLAGRSPAGVAFLPTLLVIFLYLVNVRSATALWERTKSILRALDSAGRGLVLLVFLGFGAQVIIALIGLAGVGTKLSDSVIGLSQQDLFAALLLTALVCTVLGMGVATAADYVLASSVIVPALVALMLGMGYLEQDARFVSHLLILHWASSSAITPPWRPRSSSRSASRDRR